MFSSAPLQHDPKTGHGKTPLGRAGDGRRYAHTIPGGQSVWRNASKSFTRVSQIQDET
jgi:hypothetical protein